ncbi:MAG TPA: NrfD/PsrC family molybdoenzyme membrane anchor subunit [Planctomycetota bacterium]|nr:NrfD/PsrC family molybdoenzyme membrane anchor subunit [Planctomycetota bacterium]
MGSLLEVDGRRGSSELRWWSLAVFLAGLVALGMFGYAQQLMHGDLVSGLRTIGQGGAAWGLYIVFDITFVGLAFGGLVFMTVVRLFHLRALRPLSRMAQIMALISLGMAGLCVIADLGRPLQGLLNFPKYARPMSPFFGTFSLVTCTGCVATFIYLWLDSRADAATQAARGGFLRPLHLLMAAGWRNTPAEAWRHKQTSYLLALALLPFMLIGASTLGFVFGIQAARPGWFGTLQAPGFVVLALISSMGVLTLIAAAARRKPSLAAAIRPEIFGWLGNMMWILTAVYLYIVAIEELTASYAASAVETRVADSLISGAYAVPFWTAMACFVVPAVLLFLQFLRRRVSVATTVICALLLNAAAIVKRLLIVVPSQTEGLLLPYPKGHYLPSWVELAVIGGLIALGVLACLVFARLFPIVPLITLADERSVPHADERPKQRASRLFLTGATLCAGLALAVTGFLLSARFGTERWQDPLVPFSPILFISGMVLIFGSALVYELLPDAGKRAPDPVNR